MESEKLRECILRRLTKPVIFRGIIKEWPASKWTLANLYKVLGEHLLKFRIGRQDPTDINLETECQYRYATVSQFCEWIGNACSLENPLKCFDSVKYWCYADYKHICEIFDDDSEVLKSIDWSHFGFDGRNGKESTLWIGSRGSNTVCHYDTYGCNLVAQIYGRKKWTLFPPEQTTCMYPTRIPFEESSYFSQVNINKPDFNKFPLFQAATPYIVTLEPGDVLYVPHHWFHHVQCIDHAISINSWIELECDHVERMKEAVVRCVAFKMMGFAEEEANWLNPTEEETTHKENLHFLNMSLNVLMSRDELPLDGASIKRKSHDGFDDDEEPTMLKKCRHECFGLNDASKQDKNVNIQSGSLTDAAATDNKSDVIVSAEFDSSHIIKVSSTSVAGMIASVGDKSSSCCQDDILTQSGCKVTTVESRAVSECGEPSSLSTGSASCLHPDDMSIPGPSSSSPRQLQLSQSHSFLTFAKLTKSILQPGVINLIFRNLFQDVKTGPDP